MEVFDLSKENRFNLTGEFTVEIIDEKQIYKLVAIHPNRTIEWTSEYSSLNAKTHQSSKIILAKNIWLGYNIDVLNHTRNEHESQQLTMKISYPARDISLSGLYILKNNSLDTDVTIQWFKNEDNSENGSDNEDREKIVQGKVQWRDFEGSAKKTHQNILIGLKHPSFNKDVILEGIYFRDGLDNVNIELNFNYTEDEDHHAKFKTDIKNLSEDVGYKNYTISVVASHVASELNLIFDGSFGIKPNYYRIESTGSYKRGYLPDMELELLGFVDIDNKEIKVYVSYIIGKFLTS